MQLETDAVVNLFRQRVAIALDGSLVGELRQIVGLELDTVDLVVAAQFLDFLLSLLRRQGVLTVLIAGKLLIELLFRELLAPLLLCTETLWDREERHDGVGIQTVGLHLIQYLYGVRHCLWHVAEDVVHLLTRFKPLLFRVEHTGGIVEILTSGETEQMIMGLGILLIHKVGIVRAHQFHTVFFRQLDEHLIRLLLQGECLTVRTDGGIGHLMTLQLQIVVVAPEPLVPLDGLTCPGDVAFQNLCRHLTGDTGRTHNQVLVVFLQLVMVCTRTTVEAIHP